MFFSHKGPFTLKTTSTIIEQLCVQTYFPQTLHKKLGARCKEQLLLFAEEQAHAPLQLFR